MGKMTVIFVDDLNMPALETYGAQPPVEILRQWQDHGGWYDRKENVFRTLVDLTWVTAMGPPGGGRNHITPRYMRHYNIVGYTPFDDASMQRIFQTILDWWLRKDDRWQTVAPLCAHCRHGMPRIDHGLRSDTDLDGLGATPA